MVDDLLGREWGRAGGPKLSDAELVCLAIAQVLLGCDSDRRWLGLANQRLGHLFPYLPTPSAYNRRLRRARSLVQDLAAHTPSWGDRLRLVTWFLVGRRVGFLKPSSREEKRSSSRHAPSDRGIL